MTEDKEREKIRDKILELTRARGENKTICPSEVVRSLYKEWVSKISQVYACLAVSVFFKISETALLNC